MKRALPSTKFRMGLLVLVALAVTAAVAADVIDLHNAPTKQVGALVDGASGGARVNDARYLKLDLGGFFDAVFPVIPLDDFVPDATQNEIIGFAHRRPPILVPGVAWTAFDDRIDVTFEDEYHIPLQIWIVEGPFSDQRLRAADASVETAEMWATERTGLAFSEVLITDVTTVEGIEPFADFTCGDDAEAMKTAVGFIPDRINVYYVRTVDFGTGPGSGNGVWCPGPKVIAMGRYTGGLLLAHEIGHAFNLVHTVGPGSEPYFDTTNVMHNSSNVRRYLTEGQNFRVVHDPASLLNTVYDVRPQSLTRSCPHSYTESATCPSIQKRIWSDGESWPPN